MQTNAQQANLNNNYKDTRLKLPKTNAAQWFNKMCKVKQLNPNYTNIKINGQKPQDKKTRSIIFIMRNFGEKKLKEIWNACFVLSNFTCNIFFSIYEIMWENTVDPERPQMIIWRMRISRYEVKAANTHSEYVILTAFPQQQWLH